MSRLILLPAADHVFYSEGDQEEDENDADDGELVPLAGLVGQKEEDENDADDGELVPLAIRGSGRGHDRLIFFFYPGPLCPSLIKLIKLIHF